MVGFLANWVGLSKKGVMLHDKPRPAPEPAFARPRPMTGLFASLTEEQKAFVLGLTVEDETHGSDDTPRIKK